MAAWRLLPLLSLLFTAATMAAPPILYRQAAYESPVRGAPDDLLLLAGYGFAVDDTVVYRAISDTTAPLTPPREVPAQSDADSGIAPVVSAADVPYALTIKLPITLRSNQSYALWVHTAGGEWSLPVDINDARPLWISPSFVYESGMPASLPREIKVIGRNLEPSPGHSTIVKLEGPQQFTGRTKPSAEDSIALDDYVGRMALPPRLKPGRYRVMMSRDGSSWVTLQGQSLEVRPDPPPRAVFSVGDARFGGCRPDDGADDTACIIRAISAASRAGGGEVRFTRGTWDLIKKGQPGVSAVDGILVPQGVELHGDASSATRIDRHAEWNSDLAAAAFTLVGRTLVTGFSFHDLQIYKPADKAGPFLQLGENWSLAAPARGDAAADSSVQDIVITRNIFDKPMVAIASGGLPIERLFMTFNRFGAYHAALELSGDKYNVAQTYRIDDSVIDFNDFLPGSKLDLVQKTGTIASELGAAHHMDFSNNHADGESVDYLYSRDDAKGWRASFFWSLNSNVEETLVSRNRATCTGDKIGDGEAIAFDNNSNTFAFRSVVTIADAGPTTLSVAEPLAPRQHDRDVPVANFYVGHWIQIVSGPGLGQVRKIVGYTTDAASRHTTFTVAPRWDVVPAMGRSRAAVGREFWQVYALANEIDNRQPLCQKSNRSRRAAGQLVLWAQSADSVIAANRQYDSDGIFVQQSYVVPEHPCANCTMESFFQTSLEIRDNIVDGKYDADSDCSRSGIAAGIAAAPWETEPPPIVGFGVSISHNTVTRADAQYGGGIAQLSTWYNGPEPQRWPLSDGLLIHHNAIANIAGPKSLSLCGASPAKIGIAFPDAAIAWRTVLYANRCSDVSTPLGPGGTDSIKVCPSSGPDSCECPRAAP